MAILVSICLEATIIYVSCVILRMFVSYRLSCLIVLEVVNCISSVRNNVFKIFANIFLSLRKISFLRIK